MAILNKVQCGFSEGRHYHHRFIWQPRTICGTAPHALAKLSDMKPALVEQALDHLDGIAAPGHFADWDAVQDYVHGA